MRIAEIDGLARIRALTEGELAERRRLEAFTREKLAVRLVLEGRA